MITAEQFKTHFSRDFPYLPLWVDGKAYFIGDVVYDGLNFYTSIVDGNLSPLSDGTAWKLSNISTDSYLNDHDITKAIAEMQAALNQDLFGQSELELIEYYLTAYYLVVDIKNSTAGLNSTAYGGYISSKSVGGISESYGIPSWAMNDPMLGLYMDNGYGKKYLTYLLPSLKANSLFLSCGAVTNG